MRIVSVILEFLGLHLGWRVDLVFGWMINRWSCFIGITSNYCANAGREANLVYLMFPVNTIHYIYRIEMHVFSILMCAVVPCITYFALFWRAIVLHAFNYSSQFNLMFKKPISEYMEPLCWIKLSSAKGLFFLVHLIPSKTLCIVAIERHVRLQTWKGWKQWNQLICCPVILCEYLYFRWIQVISMTELLFW